MSDLEAGSRRSRAPMWVGGLISLAITTATIFWLWALAVPLPAGTACITIFPPPAGCAGTARLFPAAVWSIASVAATIGAFTLHRRSWWGAAIWIILTALVGVVGYFATLYMRVFVIA